MIDSAIFFFDDIAEIGLLFCRLDFILVIYVRIFAYFVDSCYFSCETRNP